MNEIYQPGHYVARIIAAGSFLDDDPGCGIDPVLVQVFMVRLNFEAMSEWFSIHNNDAQLDDAAWFCWHPLETREEFQVRIQQLQDALNAQIAAELGLDLTKGSFNLSRNVSEIFTVVFIQSTEEEARRVHSE